jgi:hypothetical protein
MLDHRQRYWAGSGFTLLEQTENDVDEDKQQHNCIHHQVDAHVSPVFFIQFPQFPEHIT